MSDSTERVMARYLTRSRVKVAAFPPQPPGDQNANDGSGVKRNIPKGHEFQAKALKPLAKALWASTVALGHTLTAYRHLSRIKSVTVSPDGLMGGRGYVMKLAEMRQKLYEASEALSTISDTIHDEINAPHWQPKLAQLDDSDQEDVTRFVEEAEGVMENPEGEAEDEIEEIESKKSEGKKPKKKKPKKVSEDEESSGLPSADASQAESTVHDDTMPRTKEASVKVRRPGMSDRAWIMEFYSDPSRETTPDGSLVEAIYVRPANSSLPVSELPGGPRVDHIGPGTGTGDYGDFNPSEGPPHDPWSADGAGIARRDDSGEDFDYPSEWENDLSRSAGSKAAAAGIPDSFSDDTPTEGYDFGLGYGARGQGAGGYANPSGEGRGKGVWGPQSGLPGTPPQSSGDTTNVMVDEKLNRHARDALYGLMPGDVAGDVARADYYTGAKDNMVSVGTSQVPTPPDARSEGGESLMDTYYTVDDLSTPFDRFDGYPRHDRDEPFASDGEATR